ncbi:MAG: ADP-forming succinate--CoA ligase subunit beta [Candidatus Thermoplasmatota archaeon]
MNILEYKAKEVFKRYGIEVPNGKIITNENEISNVNKKVALKAQVPTGGRGKAGGIKFASNTDEAKKFAKELLGMEIRGYKVREVLIEDALDIEKELYLGFTIDRERKASIIIASAKGGVDIESVDEAFIYKKLINPFVGLQPFIIRELLLKLGIKGNEAKEIGKIATNLYSLFKKEDAELVEINPLVLTKDGKVTAGDAKLVIDNDSLFRHPEYKIYDEDLPTLEREARRKGISFIQLDGNIGVIANGAGLTMATLDSLIAFGGKGGVFLDLGGTDDPEKVKECFVLMKKANPKVILMNIFGGITKCDTVAQGVKEVILSEGIKCPIVGRIKGLNEERAREILKDAGLIPALTIEEAAEKATKLAG